MNNMHLLKKELEVQKRYATKIYNKLNDVLGDISEKEIANKYEEVSLGSLFTNGQYIYSEKTRSILQALRTGTNEIDYFDLKGTYYASSTFARALTSSKFKPRTQLHNSGIINAFSNEHIKEIGINTKRCYDYNNQPLPKCAITKESSSKVYKLGNLYIQKKETYERSSYGRRYSYTNTTYDIFDEEGNLTCYKSKDIVKNKIKQELEGFEICDKLPKQMVEIYKGSRYSAICEHCYYSDGKFYFKIGISYDDIILAKEAQTFKDIKYVLLDDALFVYTEEHSNCWTLTTEYTARIREDIFAYIVDGQIVFLEKPYYKYGDIEIGKNKVKITFGHQHYIINEDDISLKSPTASLPIVKDIPEGTTIIPSNRYFYILDKTGCSIFYKPNCSIVSGEAMTNIYNKFKKLRYGRKNSDLAFLADDNTIYFTSNNNYMTIRLYLDGFNKESIKVVAYGAFYVETIDTKTPYIIYNGRCIGVCCCKLKYPFRRYKKFFVKHDVIIGVLRNGQVQVGENHLLEIKEGTLYHNDKIVCSNAVLEEDYIRIKRTTSVSTNANFSITISFDDYTHELVTQRSTMYLVSVSKDLFSYSENGEYKLGLLKEDKSIPIDYSLYATIQSTASDFLHLETTQFIIDGYLITHVLLSQIMNFNVKLYNKIRDYIIIKLRFSNLTKDELIAIIDSVIAKYLVTYANTNGLYITLERLEKNPYVDELKVILTCLKNINDHLDSKSKELFKHDLTCYINSSTYKLSSTPEFKLKNARNINEMLARGIPYTKFNEFDFSLDFVASNKSLRATKTTIINTLTAQIRNLLGSYKENVTGILNIIKLSDLYYLQDYLIGNTKGVTLPEEITVLEEMNMIEGINKLGKKLYGFLKGYQITFKSHELYICNQSAYYTSNSKLLLIAKRFIEVTSDIQKELPKYISNEKVLELISLLINWSVKHVSDDIANLVIEDETTPKELIIKLWNRDDFAHNLLQGTRTHCCLALDSFNCHELINYIYNLNINLIEILHKDRIVGQAFVYIGETNTAINYNCEYRPHYFLIIDNVEINNSFSSYSIDITRKLQEYMIAYKQHLGNVISDVWLGTFYNDIEAPFPFQVSQSIDIIGNNFYRDSSRNFYKFI